MSFFNFRIRGRLFGDFGALLLLCVGLAGDKAGRFSVVTAMACVSGLFYSTSVEWGKIIIVSTAWRFD